MKTLFQFVLTIVVLFLVNSVDAQTSGTITFTETIQLDFDLPEGMDIPEISKSLTLEKTLSFKDQRSVYKDVKNNASNDQTFTSDDGSFELTFGMDENESSYHTDYKNKTTVNQTNFMGKTFIIIVAWFTSEIPVAIGPDTYNQLPGAILMISKDDGKTEIKATHVNLEEPTEEVFELPKKGKKVTPEEFKQIVEEKTKEMAKEYGGKDAIIIKG